MVSSPMEKAIAVGSECLTTIMLLIGDTISDAAVPQDSNIAYRPAIAQVSPSKNSKRRDAPKNTALRMISAVAVDAYRV